MRLIVGGVSAFFSSFRLDVQCCDQCVSKRKSWNRTVFSSQSLSLIIGSIVSNYFTCNTITHNMEPIATNRILVCELLRLEYSQHIII